MRLPLILLFMSTLAACAPNVGEAFLQAKASADRARAAGRYEEAARGYREAAEKAQRRRDRDEALFLEAGIHQRSGNLREAAEVYRSLISESPNGERAPRAHYELAWIEIESGGENEGYAKLKDALLAHPRAGVARRALGRYLDFLDESQGERASLLFLEETLARGGDDPALGENLLYERAKRLESLGELAAARDSFLDCARRYPYPFGSLFDDALFRASLIDERLGRYEAAIEHLEELLKYREVSTLNGSYERARYAEAQMRIAELYRDKFGDSASARRAFHKLYSDHETSLLRDDALWEEAKLALLDGDTKAACERVELLVRDLPESRYAACAHLLCEGARPPERADDCRAYIARSIAEASEGARR